ncbi:hypothetical protein DFP72DRAFT_1068956 [Ephemerocybe angulata]|uniref:Uncharacterized protein n=1 Tax=Ephemerocybe angulata TaxID=980116 RepID=A0A8H6M7I2_9AGAR|nr:hypothetical protein DFP72DRAFT_1068956 [Tulosesus angulatus]
MAPRLSTRRPLEGNAVDWKLTAPEIEVLSFVHGYCGWGWNRWASDVTQWTERIPFPTTFHLLEVGRTSKETLNIQKNLPLRVESLESHLRDVSNGGSQAPILRVLWLVQGKDHAKLNVPSAPDVVAWMGQKLGVSPLFMDTLFTQQPPIPLSKLSEWPRGYTAPGLGIDKLAGVYRVANGNCVWFRHEFPREPDGARVSTYVVSGKYVHADLFLNERVHYVHHAIPRRSGLTEFMAVDLLLNDNTMLGTDINTYYSDLTKSLSSLGDASEQIPGLVPIDPNRRKHLYTSLNKAYKALGVVGSQCDLQVEVIKLLKQLAVAYSYLYSEGAVQEQRRVQKLHSALDSLGMATNLVQLDVTSRLQYFSTLMNLHMGTLMQIDSATSMEIADSSKKIAEETRKDSASMTTIAVMTMFFLPGTLVAGVFSTPFFGNAAEVENMGISSKFWWFWAFTISLTILVGLVWMFIQYKTTITWKNTSARRKAVGESLHTGAGDTSSRSRDLELSRVRV